MSCDGIVCFITNIYKVLSKAVWNFGTDNISLSIEAALTRTNIGGKRDINSVNAINCQLHVVRLFW